MPSHHLSQLPPLGYLGRKKFSGISLFCILAAKGSWNVFFHIVHDHRITLLQPCSSAYVHLWFKFSRFYTSLFLSVRDSGQTLCEFGGFLCYFYADFKLSSCLELCMYPFDLCRTWFLKSLASLGFLRVS